MAVSGVMARPEEKSRGGALEAAAVVGFCSRTLRRAKHATNKKVTIPTVTSGRESFLKKLMCAGAWEDLTGRDSAIEHAPKVLYHESV